MAVNRIKKQKNAERNIEKDSKNSESVQREYRTMMTELIRLDKFLADMQIGTRSQVKQMIRRKQVSVNGITALKPEQKVDCMNDTVTVSGQKVVYEKYRYLLLHKPAGYVTATTDKKEKTVLDLVPESMRKNLFPVGRLDKDTEGLLLLTDDGALAHRLLSPAHHVDKTYYVQVDGKITEEDQRVFADGMDIGDEKLTLPAELKTVSVSSEQSTALVTIREGRYHQIKRMFLARGKKVLYLKRLSMGPIVLGDDLLPGMYRRLTEEEREALQLLNGKD